MNDHTILAVNDAPNQSGLLVSILVKAGYCALSADNVTEALKIAQRETPDLIIGNLMTDTDGIEFCRKIRADDELRLIPILLIGDLPKDAVIVARGLEELADDYIEAPYEPLRLIAKAARLIERERMNDALRDNANRFRTMIENVMDIITILAPDGTIIYESPSLENILGYKPEKVIGQSAFDFIHPEDKKKVIEYFNLAIGSFDAVSSTEYRFLHKDGSWRIIESVGKPFIDPSKGLVVIVNSRDITERNNALEARRESENRFQLISRATNDALWDWDLVTNSVWYGEGFYNLFGCAPEEVEPDINSWYEAIHPDDKERVIDHIHAAIKKKENSWTDEYRLRSADGSDAYIYDRGYIIYSDDGKPLQMIGAAVNITERKQAESNLRFQKSLLESQSEASIDGFLVVAPGGEIISYNQRFVEMWGISNEAFSTKSDEIFVQTILEKLVEPEEFLETIEYLYQNPFVKDQIEIPLKDGRTFERYSAPVIDTDETHLGRIWSFRDITNRKKTEEKLLESEERYRLLFESNPLPMWVYDVETLRFLAVNDAATFHYGYSREEFLSMTIKDIRSSEDIPALLENISKVGGGINAAGFWRHRKKNGDIIDVDITSHEVVFAGERAELVLAIDVTERKKTEESIRFQAHLLDTVEQAVIAADLNGIVVYWNRFAERLYGWTAAEAVGRSILELTTPEIGQEQAAAIMTRLGAGKSWSGEFTVRNKNGETFPAYISNSPIPDGDGKSIGIVGVSIGISERKEAEEALRQAESRYRNLVELSPAIVYLAQPFPPYSTIYISPNVKVFGYQSEEWFGRDDMWLSMIHEEDRERVLRNTKNAISQGLNTEIEYRIVGRGGEIFCVHDKGCFISDEKGNKIGWQRVILDITETKKLEEQLRQSQKLESVGKLAGGIAHDFNNMLTAINGYSDLTLRRLKHDDPLRGNIEEIKKAGERSASLTQQLLAFSRQQVLKPKVLNLNEVIIDISNMLNRLIGEHIQLNIVSGSELGLVEADPGQLTQVIMNLAVNARDAMPDRGDLTIETSNVYLDREFAEKHFPTQPGAYVLLAVTDTGAGIVDEIKQHIFEPFYTTKETGKGTGLGLATVYGIVKQSGGYIWTDSEIGKGTTFSIYLPRFDKEAASSDKSKASEILQSGTETILLVEDEDIVRNMSRQMLEDCGYQVIEAQNGLEALSVCERQSRKIDLLMTDVVMPQMGGRELAERLAQTHPNIRLLFTSGYTDDAIIRKGTIMEGVNFIQKPFTFAALSKKVREMLDAKNETQNIP